MQRRTQQYDVVFVEEAHKGSLSARSSFEAITSGRYLYPSAAEPIHHFHPFSRPAGADVRLNTGIIQDELAERIAKTAPPSIRPPPPPAIRPLPPPSVLTSEDEIPVYFAASYSVRQPNASSQLHLTVMAGLIALGASRFSDAFSP